jgi:hydroxymethylpyrimidine pyrophosphatase-like HAD family hydrolase
MTDQTLHYSSAAEIEAFVAERIAETRQKTVGGTAAAPQRLPLFVLDLDGNSVVGYSVCEGKHIPDDYPISRNRQVPRAGIVDGGKQTIPYDADITALQEQGVIAPSLFASHTMDVRLPQNLAHLLRACQTQNRPFEVTILTSRGMEDTKKILHASGIDDVKHLTFVADSGATAYVNGIFCSVHKTTQEEIDFIAGLHTMQAQLDTIVHGVVGKTQINVWIEAKTAGLAANVHYRAVLDELGLAGKERARKDSLLRKAIANMLDVYIQQHSPKHNGKAYYSMLNGPETIELKHPAVNKGRGLRYLVQHALATKTPPSCIIYAGDDVTFTDQNSGITTAGTDYDAFLHGYGIEEETGIPFYTIHTLHPASKHLFDATVDAKEAGIIADASRIIAPISGSDDAHVHATIITASPLRTIGMVQNIITNI